MGSGRHWRHWRPKTLEIIGHCQYRAKWPNLPSELGPWQMAHIPSSGRVKHLAVAFSLAHELPQAVPRWLVADRGATTHAVREHICNLNIRPVILPQRDEVPIAGRFWIHSNRPSATESGSRHGGPSQPDLLEPQRASK